VSAGQFADALYHFNVALSQAPGYAPAIAGLDKIEESLDQQHQQQDELQREFTPPSVGSSTLRRPVPRFDGFEASSGDDRDEMQDNDEEDDFVRGFEPVIQ
jgi:hypothetical protein